MESMQTELFGGAEHSYEIVKRLSENGKLIGIDRDQEALKAAKEKLKDFSNVIYVHDNHDNIKEILEKLNIEKVDGILLELGVSSYQLDERNRGFSYLGENELDMRMDKTQKLTAKEIVNTYSEEELANIIYNYGDEVKSRHIAKKIVELRKIKPIETTFELADIVRSFYTGKKGKIDPATKTFQAIRIAVNDELNELRKILEISKKVLNKDGRLVVVCFHSLEDKIVKDYVKQETNKGKKNDKYSKNIIKADFELLTKKAITPNNREVQNNIRSRSAKLRALKKC